MIGSRIFLVAALALAACGGGDAIGFEGERGEGVGNEGPVAGGPCASNADCAPGSECALGGDFPGGTCTLRCDSDQDCPNGTACIDESGGICLLLCNFDTDCRVGYECDDESRKGASGSATVCIDD